MEINLNENTKKFLSLFLLILLPMLLLLGIVLVNYIQPWYLYITIITWIGIGIMFYSAIN